jgi:GNAT superfamily N-acetyltransferase
MSEDSIEWFDVDGRIARTAAGWLGLPHVPIKSLGQRHAPKILEHMLSLGEEDRRLRFGSRLGDAGIQRYVESIDFEGDGLFGVFDQHLRLRAFCHMAVLEYEGLTAGELGLSVDPEYRGHGLGSLLFARACNHARIKGIQRAFVHCLMENRSMLNIALKAGMEVDSGGGEYEAHLRLPPAWTGTHLQEALHEQMAIFDVIFKRQINRAKSWAEWAGDATSAVISTVAEIPGAVAHTVAEIPGAVAHTAAAIPGAVVKTVTETIPDAISTTVSGTVSVVTGTASVVAEIPGVVVNTVTETIPDAIQSTAEVGAQMVNPMNFLASSPSKTESDIDRLLKEMPPPETPEDPPGGQ